MSSPGITTPLNVPAYAVCFVWYVSTAVASGTPAVATGGGGGVVGPHGTTARATSAVHMATAGASRLKELVHVPRDRRFLEEELAAVRERLQ